MRKLALTLSALGILAFAGVARADQKTENSEKTDSTTTLGGKHKTTHIKKMSRSDGSSSETKVETTTPKDVDRRDIDRRDMDRRDDTRDVRDEGKNEVNEKTEHHRTLTGKDETKTTKKVEKPDGTQVETTTTTTEPKDNEKK